MWQINGLIEVRVTVGVCLTFLYTVCSAGSRSSSMWKRGGLVDDSFMGSGRAMILPSSPNHFFPLIKNKNKTQFKEILDKRFTGNVTVELPCWLRLPPPFSKCGSPECSHWSGTQEVSPLHTDPRPPDSEASCFQAV